MSKIDSTFLKKYAPVIAMILIGLMTLSFLWFSYNKRMAVQDSLKTAVVILGESDGVEDYRDFASGIKNVRITIIDKNGNVLADNEADKATMGNHSDRPEFVQAREKGYGEDIRKSETTNKNTIYVMTKLKNGKYVRLAQSIELTYEFLLWLFAPIIFLSSCLAALMFVFAKNKQIEKMRQEFVANVSHELKTPLTSIKGFAELTSTGLVNDVDTVKEYQRKIVAQSDRLLATINDILHLSRLESAKPKKIAPVDTKASAEQVKDALKHLADEKNIIIQISGTGSVLAEPEPIYNMIYNLVDNGIKYGKNGGFVKINLSDKKIIVSDNGIGIPQEDVERVFERFYRVDKSRSVKTGGTGLGLAIVKHTVQKYGGTVSIKSGDGNGTQIIAEFSK